MYTLIRKIPLRELLTTQGPALLISFVIAERFYKLGSFMWECLAFLATWFVVDVLFTSARQIWLDRRGSLPSK